MNHIPYEKRCKTYLNALITYGDRAQMIVAVEELSELQKEICKILRGGENYPHLAEEIADVSIMLEQLRMMFHLDDQVEQIMDEKVLRLDDRLKCGKPGGYRAVTDCPYRNGGTDAEQDHKGKHRTV